MAGTCFWSYVRHGASLLVRSKAPILVNASSFQTSNLVGIFSNDALSYSDKIEAGSQQPLLSDMVQRAIEFLQYNTWAMCWLWIANSASAPPGKTTGNTRSRNCSQWTKR